MKLLPTLLLLVTLLDLGLALIIRNLMHAHRLLRASMAELTYAATSYHQLMSTLASSRICRAAITTDSEGRRVITVYPPKDPNPKAPISHSSHDHHSNERAEGPDQIQPRMARSSGGIR